jgi:hypothetical protein
MSTAQQVDVSQMMSETMSDPWLGLQAFQLERDQRQASITRRELKISEMVGSKESLAQQLEAAQAELQRQRREIEQLMETVKGHLEQEMLLQEMLRGREAELQVYVSPWDHKFGIVSIRSVCLMFFFLTLPDPPRHRELKSIAVASHWPCALQKGRAAAAQLQQKLDSLQAAHAQLTQQLVDVRAECERHASTQADLQATIQRQAEDLCAVKVCPSSSPGKPKLLPQAGP